MGISNEAGLSTMLDRVRGRYGESEAPYQASLISYDDIARFIRRYLVTIALFIIAGGAAGATYAWTAAPVFTARAQLLIDAKLPTSLREGSGDGIVALDTPQVESQIAVLRSEQIAEQIVSDLQLLSDPEFDIPSGSASPWKLLSFGARRASEPSQFERRRHAIALLQAGLDVRRVGLSYVLDISYASRDPEKAARMANEVADRFVKDQLSTRAKAAQQGSEWLEERIDELRKQMNAAALTVQEFKARRDYRIGSRRDRGQDAENAPPSNAPPKEEVTATLEELESGAHTYRKIYESYLQAYAESVQRQSYPVANARVITSASRPLRKSHPKTAMVIALGLLFGALAGCGIAVVRHSLDRSLHTSKQIRDQIGIQCLGQVVRYEPRQSANRGPLGKSSHGRRAGPGLRAVLDAPFSRFSDSVKSVKTALGLATKGRQFQSLGVTSALPREGKTVLAGNLAALYKISGARTLLVDADLRNPAASRILAPNCKLGLINVLAGEATLSECIVFGTQPGIPDLLPVVANRPLINSSDALGSEAMLRLIRELPAEYDMVIFDLPPLKPLADALVVSALLDGVITVIEWGATPAPQVADVVHGLIAAQATVLGAILTKVDGPAQLFYGPYSVALRSGA